jgi:hypothetical protein
MNQARDDDGKASLLQAFLDAVALWAHDDEGDDDPRLSAKPKDECRPVIVRGQRIHPANKAAPRKEHLFPAVADAASNSSNLRPPVVALTAPLGGKHPRVA